MTMGEDMHTGVRTVTNLAESRKLKPNCLQREKLVCLCWRTSEKLRNWRHQEPLKMGERGFELKLGEWVEDIHEVYRPPRILLISRASRWLPWQEEAGMKWKNQDRVILDSKITESKRRGVGKTNSKIPGC